MWQPPDARRQPFSARTTWLILGAILVAALGLRVWYASAQLDTNRFWDEGYSLENVAPILLEGTLEPQRGFYPSPVFNLPAAAIVAAGEAAHKITGKELFRSFEEGRFYPMAMLLLRIQQALYSVGAVFLVFLIGRWLFSTEAGLFAALTLAGMPWHVQAAAVFKPDSLLSFTSLLAFWLSLRMIRGQPDTALGARPSSSRLRRVGADGAGLAIATGGAIALAMSAKMTGGLLAIPLTLSMLLTARQAPRRLLLLALTGGSSAIFFVLLNPYWRRYPAYLENLSRDYEMRAGWQQWTHWQVPGRVLELLLEPETLGLILGPLSLIGFGALVVAIVPPSRLGWSRRSELAI